MNSSLTAAGKWTARELLAINLLRLRAELAMSQEDVALEANLSTNNIDKLTSALNIPVHQHLMPHT